VRPRFTSRSAPAGAVFAAALLLGGCAATPADLDAKTAVLLQNTVVDAAEQAAAGDSTGALTTLGTLESQLDFATATGDVTDARAEEIRSSIALVRADLEAAIAAAAVQPAPQSEPAPPTDQEPVSESEQQTEPVLDEPEPAETPPDDAGPDDSGSDDSGSDDAGPGDSGSGNGNSGNGKNANNGNGNGNGKNK
jgi:hypothetical protein